MLVSGHIRLEVGLYFFLSVKDRVIELLFVNRLHYGTLLPAFKTVNLVQLMSPEGMLNFLWQFRKCYA